MDLINLVLHLLKILNTDEGIVLIVRDAIRLIIVVVGRDVVPLSVVASLAVAVSVGEDHVDKVLLNTTIVLVVWLVLVPVGIGERGIIVHVQESA